ncbi:epoxide hydrolase family protein [Lentzea tibetensis]|nr:epoxide hydrolase family protein [Lentzea tibetensis]
MKPFRIDIPQSALDDLHARLDLTRWPHEPAGIGWQQGTPVSYLRELVRYWRHEFDWRAAEKRLNSYPQFTTAIDGHEVHFVHVRSANENALPLLLTHGWPATFTEFLEVVEPLSEDFHLVIPSIPGFGFSGPTQELGWTVKRVAGVWAELMRGLGYDRYVAHGNDFGSLATRELALLDDEHVLAIHVNQIFSAGVTAENADFSVEAEKRSVEKAQIYEWQQGAYAMIMGTRPQSVAYGLTDSPVAQLEWIAWGFRTWSDPDTPVDRDALLANVMIYWLTGTAGSSARYYQEGTEAWGELEPDLRVPTAVALFPHDLGVPIRRMAERNHNIVRWTEFDRGGHFAGLEVPGLLAADIRAAFEPYL